SLRQAETGSAGTLAGDDGRGDAAFVVILNVSDQMRTHAPGDARHLRIVLVEAPIRIDSLQRVIGLIVVDCVEPGMDEILLVLHRIATPRKGIGLRKKESRSAHTSLCDQKGPRLHWNVMRKVAPKTIDTFFLPIGEDPIDAVPCARTGSIGSLPTDKVKAIV